MAAGEAEGFARRWARLKRQPGTIARSAEAAPEEVPPALESLGLDEIGPWLRRRVPELWKQAAMRRIWHGDPAIRDFIGPADYAWDWNVPGGAPGYGPMRAMDDLARLLDRAIGAPEPLPAPDPPETPVAPPAVAEIGPPAGAQAATALPGQPETDGKRAAVMRRRGGGAAPV